MIDLDERLDRAAQDLESAVCAVDLRMPARGSRTAPRLLVATMSIIVVVAAGVALSSRRDDGGSGGGRAPSPVGSGDNSSTLVEVRLQRMEATIDADLGCASPIDSTGTASTMTFDFYADRAGRRWRMTVTYPNGATRDMIAVGSAIYPDSLFQRGEVQGRTAGCVLGNEPFVLLAEPGQGSLFSLNLVDELTDDELPYFNGTFAQLGQQVIGNASLPDGSPAEEWRQEISGSFIGADGVEHSGDQVTRWVVAAGSQTVHEQTLSTTVEGLGTATLNVNLVEDGDVLVPADTFDTSGYSPIEAMRRPPNLLPTNDQATVPSPSAPAQGASCGTYHVVAGDFPLRVATLFDTTVEALRAVNAATPGYDEWQPGLIIEVPC